VLAESDSPQADGAAFYETWWFWTAAGAVVVLGAVAGLALSGGGETIGTCPRGLACEIVGPGR
jgi:hypothetical protein